MRLVLAPPPSECINMQVMLPVQAYRVAVAHARQFHCTVQDVLYSAVLDQLPTLESWPDGAVNTMPRKYEAVRPGFRAPSDVMARIDAQVRKMDRKHPRTGVLVPGGSRAAVVFICVRRALSDVGSPAPMHVEPRGVMRTMPISLPRVVVEYLDRQEQPRGVSIRRAIMDELPSAAEDPAVRKGCAARRRHADQSPALQFHDSSVRIPLDTFENLKRVAKRKRMPWAELARVCVLRTVRRDTLKEKT